MKRRKVNIPWMQETRWVSKETNRFIREDNMKIVVSMIRETSWYFDGCVVNNEAELCRVNDEYKSIVCEKEILIVVSAYASQVRARKWEHRLSIQKHFLARN